MKSIGFYGVMGEKGFRKYPAVNVKETFYELHGPLDEPSPENVTYVSETSFRLVELPCLIISDYN